MSSLAFTRHACQRMQQRGLKVADVDIIFEYGTQVDDARVMLTDHDAAQAIRARKHEIAILERLKGKTLVIDGDSLITAYHADGRQDRRGGKLKSRRRYQTK
jgi:hypothetical protein